MEIIKQGMKQTNILSLKVKRAGGVSQWPRLNEFDVSTRIFLMLHLWVNNDKAGIIIASFDK